MCSAERQSGCREDTGIQKRHGVAPNLAISLLWEVMEWELSGILDSRLAFGEADQRSSRSLGDGAAGEAGVRGGDASSRVRGLCRTLRNSLGASCGWLEVSVELGRSAL